MPGWQHIAAETTSLGQGLPLEAAEPWWKDVWLRHRLNYDEQQASSPIGEAELRHELIFCLLSGHSVTFELALSATSVVSGLEPFSESWTRGKLRTALQRELSRPQFEPRRRDGSLRRYRFPKRKAELISNAVQWVHGQGSIEAALLECTNDAQRRNWLCECPGIGFKTASWLLRNTGWASQLAILDVHLIRAMKEAGLIDSVSLPRDYVAVEQTFLLWALELEAAPAALDLFLWDLQRVRDPV